MSYAEGGRTMNRAVTLIGGLGLGAGLMYLLDPARGRSRRARLRDQAIHALNQSKHGLQNLGRDLGHRCYGLMAELRSPQSTEQVSDAVLMNRIRARLG